jgi:iron complex outermembrane receptor protein
MCNIQPNVALTKQKRGGFRYKANPFILFLGFLFTVKSALAAENVNNFELSPEQLFGATVMSVSKTSEKLMDAPAAIYVISNEDIKRSGATSIPEALRMAPGVDVARVNTSGWAISIRGFNGALANKLLVLIDGREVYDPLFSGVYWDIQDTPLEDIERIEVIRGPGATLWGANAVNGVINIITKSAFDTAGNLLSFTSGNQEKAITTARHGGKLGDNSYYRMYEKSFYRNEQQDLNGGDSNDDWTSHRVGFRADSNNTEERTTFTLQGDAYHNQDTEMRNLTLTTAPYSHIDQENILARGGNVMGHWNKALSEDSKISVSSYFDYNARNQALIQDQRATYDLDAQYELQTWSHNKFIIGAKYRYSNDQLTETSGSIITFPESKRVDETFSGFIQDKITLQPEKWFLTLGSKFEHNDYTGTEIQPSARIQWHPSQTQMVWTSVSRAVRTPSRLENDLNAIQAAGAVGGTLLTVDTTANPYLQSEELMAYEAGYRNQLTEKLLLDVTTFYNDYTNLVTYTSTGIVFPPPRFIIPLTPFNNESAKTYGAEAVLNWRALDVLKLSASYSLLDMYVHGPSVSASGTTEQQSPQNQLNLRALWDVTKKVSFDTTLYYVSELEAFDVDSYTRLDMHLGWHATKDIELNLVGQNLLDDAHQEFTSPTDGHNFATEIRRSIYGNITWHF